MPTLVWRNSLCWNYFKAASRSETLILRSSLLALDTVNYSKIFDCEVFPRNSLRHVTNRFCCSLRPQKFRSQKVESETNSGWCGVVAWRLAVSRSYSGWTRTDILLCRSSHCRSMGSDCISLRGQVSNRCQNTSLHFHILNKTHLYDL